MARRRASGRAWLLRAAIALVLGLTAGAGIGVTAVRVLEPVGSITLDAASLDSVNARRATRHVADSIAQIANAPNANAPTLAAARESVTVVPKLVGLVEGDARTAIEHAGFTVGTILFRASTEPAGVVLQSFPVPGESVPLPAVINLVLSDGHPPRDSLLTPPAAPPGKPVKPPESPQPLIKS